MATTKLNIDSIIDKSIPISKLEDDIFSGTYDDMTVGFAQDIVGDGSATEEEFSFRPTAGEDRNVANTTYYEGERNGVARIESVKGNSVVWNNIWAHYNATKSTTGLTITIVGNEYTIVGDGTSTETIYYSVAVSDTTMGNKYAILGIPSGASSTTAMVFAGGNGSGFYEDTVFTAGSNDKFFYVRAMAGFNGTLVFRPVMVNLTQMFGAGNEPTTVEEFYSLLPKNVDLNAYYKGEIVDANYGAIKTTGFNQWDEQSTEGIYRLSDGVLVQQSDCLSSKNPIKVVGGCRYVIAAPNYTGYQRVVFYDKQMNFIGTDNYREFTTPQNCRYMNFSLNTYGSIYNGDVCVHLAWDEYSALNGTYAPYKPFERDLSWISKYFPEGMRRAGSVSDEIRFNSTTQKWEAVQRVGVVDLGSLSWTQGQTSDVETLGYRFLSSQVVSKGTADGAVADLTCGGLIARTAGKVWRGNDGVSASPLGQIWVYKATYKDMTASEAKSAMQGVMLNYELATPDVTEIEEIPSLDYDVADYGTEELIVAEGVQSAPLVADISYSPNALSTLKQVPDILKRLKALENAMASQTTINNVEE